MSEKRWVQHISGQGEKWEVIREHENDVAYHVRGKRLEIHPTLEHYLPKSEYRLCEPPNRWVDVTKHCDVGDEVELNRHERQTILHTLTPSVTKRDIFHKESKQEYRLRKIRLDELLNHPDKQFTTWAFIVEKKETP